MSEQQSTTDGGEVGKRKRNRWGSPQGEDVPVCVEITPVVPANGTTEEASKVRRSRFSAAPVEASSSSATEPAVPVQLSQEVIQQTIIYQLQLQKVNEKLFTVVKDALAIEADPRRSPSPPPRYDSSGKRTNTREVRMRDALMKEKTRLIEELMKLNPTYQAPIDFIKSKPVKIIYLPKQTDPNTNYIGLIIGPRGNTQKEMEQATNTKISIRGKGSAKEGSKNRAKNADDDEELHVHISGEDMAGVEKAAKLIEALLVPQDDSLNEHKQKQLRELALINGTLREDEYCPVCGEKGHRQFECPHRARSFKAAGVKCSICGDMSHPTRDCPLKHDTETNQVTLDSEYDSFMAELTEGPSKSKLKSSNSDSSSASGEGTGSADANRATGKPGPTYVAPIVDLVPNRKARNQTVITVTTVMTGLVPPVFSSSTAPPTSGSVSAPASTAYPSFPTYHMPGAAPPSAPSGYNGVPLSGVPGMPAGAPGWPPSALGYPSAPTSAGPGAGAGAGAYPGYSSGGYVGGAYSGASGSGMQGYGNYAPPMYGNMPPPPAAGAAAPVAPIIPPPPPNAGAPPPPPGAAY